MKAHVKDNILTALADVKMKLLQEYHTSNVKNDLTKVKKLTEGNPDTLISLVHEKQRNKIASERKISNRHMASA